MEGNPRLSSAARDAFERPGHEVYLSAASAFEIATKVRIGRLELADEAEFFVPEEMRRHRIAPLAIQQVHALRVVRLPLHHRDPFDRLLIAQAQVEDLTLLTPDPAIGSYDVGTYW